MFFHTNTFTRSLEKLKRRLKFLFSLLKDLIEKSQILENEQFNTSLCIKVNRAYFCSNEPIIPCVPYTK